MADALIGGGDPGDRGGDHDEVVYDLADWEPELRATLERLLVGKGIAFRWVQATSLASWMTPNAVSGPSSQAFLSAELVVAGPKADVVEELIDELDHPDALAAEDDDGDDVGAEVLSSLYVAADVLCAAPGHLRSAEDLFEAARATAEMAAPYGIEAATWAELGRLAEDLARSLRYAGDDQVVVDAARRLRQAAHALV